MKKTMIITLFGMIAALTAVHADNQKMMDAQKPAQQSMCGAMSADEQAFSKQLNASNQSMFCMKFTASQRSSAMQMAGKADASGNMMTADQAVQKVAMDNNMTPAQQKSQGGCPVK